MLVKSATETFLWHNSTVILTGSSWAYFCVTCHRLCLTWFFFLITHSSNFLHFSFFVYAQMASIIQSLLEWLRSLFFKVCIDDRLTTAMLFLCHPSNCLILDWNGADSGRLAEQRENHFSQRHCSMCFLSMLMHCSWPLQMSCIRNYSWLCCGCVHAVRYLPADLWSLLLLYQPHILQCYIRFAILSFTLTNGLVSFAVGSIYRGFNPNCRLQHA